MKNYKKMAKNEKNMFEFFYQKISSINPFFRLIYEKKIEKKISKFYAVKIRFFDL